MFEAEGLNGFAFSTEGEGDKKMDGREPRGEYCKQKYTVMCALCHLRHSPPIK